MLRERRNSSELKLRVQQVSTEQRRELCLMLHSRLAGRGVLRRMGTCMYKAEFLCCLPETTITLFLGYTQIQNKKLKKKKLKK